MYFKRASRLFSIDYIVALVGKAQHEDSFAENGPIALSVDVVDVP